MNNNKIVESFEAFNKDNLEYLKLYKKTYIDKFDRIKIEDSDIFDQIKDYDINKFKCIERTYGFFIYPDNDFIELVKKIDSSATDDLFFYITIGKDNQIDFTEGIPEKLRGLSIAYKLYKMIISRVGWITSDKYSSHHSYNLWYNLLQDRDLYCFTSSKISGLISKQLSDIDIKNIVSKIENLSFNIELDDKLREKIKNTNA